MHKRKRSTSIENLYGDNQPRSKKRKREREKGVLRPYIPISFLQTQNKQKPLDIVFFNDFILVVVYESEVMLWDIHKRAIIARINILEKVVNSVAVSGKYLGVVRCGHNQKRGNEQYDIDIYEIRGQTLQLITSIKDSMPIKLNPDVDEYKKAKIIMRGKYIVVLHYDIKIWILKPSGKLEKFKRFNKNPSDKLRVLDVSFIKNGKIGVLYTPREHSSIVDLVNLDASGSIQTLPFNVNGYKKIAFHGETMVLATDASETGQATISIFYNNEHRKEIKFTCYTEYDPIQLIIPNAYTIIITSYDSQVVTIFNLRTGVMMRQITINPCSGVIACNEQGKIAVLEGKYKRVKVLGCARGLGAIHSELNRLIISLEKTLNQYPRNTYTTASYSKLTDAFRGLQNKIKVFIKTASQDLLIPMRYFLWAFLELRYDVNYYIKVGQTWSPWERDLVLGIAGLFNFLNQTFWRIYWYEYGHYLMEPNKFYSELRPNCSKEETIYKLVLTLTIEHKFKNEKARIYCRKADLFFALEKYQQAIEYYEKVLKLEYSSHAMQYKFLALRKRHDVSREVKKIAGYLLTLRQMKLS